MAEPIAVLLVRHGEAAESWKAATDSPLGVRGMAQAEAAARTFADQRPLPILTSPMRRARETAIPFERLWNIEARVEQRVREIPSPRIEPEHRDQWLKQRLRSRWADLRDEIVDGEPLGTWRDRVLDSLRAITEPTIITTHFVVINAAVGAATGDDRVVCFRPDHASCTTLLIERGEMRVASLGNEARTIIG